MAMLPPARRGADGIYGSAGHRVVGWRVSTDSEQLFAVEDTGWRVEASLRHRGRGDGKNCGGETFILREHFKVARGGELGSG